jgi:hypothetical protein
MSETRRPSQRKVKPAKPTPKSAGATVPAAKKARQVKPTATAKKKAIVGPTGGTSKDPHLTDPKALSVLESAWALEPGTELEEYTVMGAELAQERRASLLELMADKAFRKRIATREGFSDRDRVQPVHYTGGWVPFADDGGGCLLCVDVDPGPKGTFGQVVQWELRGGGAFVRAPSLAAFLKRVGVE